MHLEDERVAVAHALASRLFSSGETARGGRSSLVAWQRYYADRLNMPIKAVVSVQNRGLADALSAYSRGKG
jgi:hypothetical protein